MDANKLAEDIMINALRPYKALARGGLILAGRGLDQVTEIIRKSGEGQARKAGAAESGASSKN